MLRVRHSREVAAVYYLNPGWAPELGGHFVDLQSPGGAVRHAPAFNSLVAFRVPRWHAVEAVAPGPAARYSVFGWWLQRGVSYELYKGGGGEAAARTSYGS